MKNIIIAFILLPFVSAKSQSIAPEQYGAKADFRRDAVSTTATSQQITCTACAFTSKDIGKVVAVKNTQIDAAYRAAPTTTNAKISSVQSTTLATLDSAMDVTNTATEMLWGTNNFDAFQKALDSAFSKGIPDILCKAGTYYIVPAKAANVPTYSGVRGLAIRGSLKISGFATVLKFGEEDVERVNASDIYAYAAIHLVGDGAKELSGLTIEAADRVSTETAYQHTNCIYTQQTANIRQNVTLKDCYIKGAWSEGFLSSRGGKWNQTTGVIEYFNDYKIERCTIEAKRQPLVIFTNDGPTKRLWVTDTEINGGGAINQGTLYCGANISAGSTTLTVTGNPTFSWYDFVSQYSNSRKPYVVVGGNFGAFSSTVVSITSPTVAVLANAPSQSYTCDTLKWYLNSDFVEGHAVYLHPNVSCSFKNVKLKNVNGYGFHIYSGGGQPGTVQFFDFDNVDARTTTGAQPSNLIPGDNVNGRAFSKGGFATIRNCNDFRATCSAKCKVFNSNVSGSFSDTTELYNCTGAPTLNGAGKKYTLFGGDYEVIYLGDSQATTTATGVFSRLVYLGQPCNATTGLIWSGGGIGGFSIDMDSSKLAQSGVFRFDGVGANRAIFYAMSYPSNWSEGTKTLFKKKFQAPEINLVQDIDINTYKNDPRGVFTFRNATSQTPISTTVNPSSQKVNEYENWTKATFQHNYNRHKIALPGTTKLQGLYPIGPNANSNLYGQNLSGMYHYQGVCEFECADTLSLTWGGLFRLRFSGARNRGEVVRLRLDPDKLLWFEEPGNSHSRASIPAWQGVNGEMVYNSAPTGVIWWEYRITTAAASETITPTSGATVEFDLAHIPYVGFREQSYVAPSSLFTLSVPLANGQVEIFAPGVHGELIGSKGSTGALRMTDGHAKLNMASQAASITATYNYVTASTWQGVGSK